MQESRELHSARSHRGKRTPGLASLIGLITCVLTLFAWRIGNSSALPSGRFDHTEHQRNWWIGSKLGPAWQSASAQSAEFIFAGDSRVKSGIDLPLIESFGIRSAAKIWRAGGRTADLLRPLLDWERPRALVVSLTPLGFVGLPNKVVAETLRAPHLACDPTVSPWRVALWAETEQVHLVEQGFEPLLAEKTMEWWIGRHHGMRVDYRADQRLVNTLRIDQDLNAFVDMHRSLWLHPIEPSTWAKAWWRKDKHGKSDSLYKSALTAGKKAALEEGYQDLEKVLGGLLERGWRIAAVRMPLEPGLRKVEDDCVAGGWLDQLVEDLEIPYRDMGTWPNATLDGSHLHMDGAAKASEEVALWLKQIWPNSY